MSCKVNYISVVASSFDVFCNFAPQPDEKTGSAEERPASNNVVFHTGNIGIIEPSYPWAAPQYPDGALR